MYYYFAAVVTVRRTHHSSDNMLIHNMRFLCIAEAKYLIQKVSHIDRRKS